ncbi:MAG: TIGR00282 family metallophosphoesterase [Spirochaetes bacterium]|nr:TIGR00282 family metallophosphoesterase [Spirochaetota bacterium]
MIIKILAIGDIVGKRGREMIKNFLPSIIEKNKPDLVIANGENISGGIGITIKDADFLFQNGIDVITTGNHVWKYEEIREYIDKNNNIIRPINYGDEVPGRGWVLFEKNGVNYLILNYVGSVFMDICVPPFYHFDNFYRKNSYIFEKADVVIVDFHAEATSEKVAFAHFLDKKVNFIFGTHTHVQTADERLISEKTAYITDIGMTGSVDSVIGFKTSIISEKFLKLIPIRYRVEEHGTGILSSCLFTWDFSNKKVLSIERINFYEYL